MHRLFKFILWSFIIFGIFYIVAINIDNRSYNFLVKHGTIEETYHTSAYVIRNEIVLEAFPKDHRIETFVKNGEKVPAAYKIATVYRNDINREDEGTLKRIDEAISEIERNDKNYATVGINEIDSVILDSAKNLVEASQNKELSKIKRIKEQIISALGRKSTQGGYLHDNLNLASLKEQKQFYDNKLRSLKHDLYSPMSGLVFYQLDGFEDAVNIDEFKNITPNDFYALEKTDIKLSGETSNLKIVNNLEWYLMFILDKKQTKGLKPGQSLTVRLDNSSQTSVQTIIKNINSFEDDSLVIVHCNKQINEVFYNRKINVEVIKSSNSGLKIPQEAIRINPETKEEGVYTIQNELIRFKNINIIGKNSNFAIVEENPDHLSSSLRLYDEIVIGDINSANLVN